MALALVQTRTMLSLPYKADTAEDLGVAIHAASLSTSTGFLSPISLVK